MNRNDGLTGLLDVLQAALDDPAASPAGLAARAHLSRFHFDRLVAAAVGEPPGALRRRLLLERAAHRLTTSGRTVLDIAVEAGYGSHEAFTRAFQRSYGLAPTAVRRRPPLTFRELELPCPSGVHFQPPGGLRLPAARQETPMNVLQHLVDHHVETLTAIIDRAGGLDEQVLDRPVTVSVETIDEQPTLRSLINAMVTQEEHWLSALRGGEWPDESDRSMTGLAARHAVAGRDWRDFVARTLAAGTLADTFVDTTCTPPTTHTLGGTIGHVITFAAVRRTLAIGALLSAGVTDLGAGDPRPYLDRAALAPTD
ncbi:helix-turn-helix domain-containing protein [Micromonospora sp. WMMA1998]|uniref:helix-turn-helix domain-containing protein n=1 Tax=Micromonospora sp. WMMA1998 TaxID=3015167 RepID=UPI00248BFAE6|nr:helix-turn-helix domain-containing protein [Micromonospora sp. WMMA1998]WBC14606.1 helix-turn-helix domain-containing protein [Micromonospora sp. WMMA1998]